MPDLGFDMTFLRRSQIAIRPDQSVDQLDQSVDQLDQSVDRLIRDWVRMKPDMKADLRNNQSLDSSFFIFSQINYEMC